MKLKILVLSVFLSLIQARAQDSLSAACSKSRGLIAVKGGSLVVEETEGPKYAMITGQVVSTQKNLKKYDNLVFLSYIDLKNSVAVSNCEEGVFIIQVENKVGSLCDTALQLVHSTCLREQ